MRYLNLITKLDTFNKLDYELYDTKELRDKGKKTSDFMYSLLLNIKEKIVAEYENGEAYMKKVKKPLKELILTQFDEKGRISTVFAIDKKLEKIVNKLNVYYLISNICDDYFNNEFISDDKISVLEQYITEKIEFNIPRQVESIIYPETTNWNKMHIPEQLKFSYVVTIAQQNIGEPIAFE